jgi:hypothetical protein
MQRVFCLLVLLFVTVGVSACNFEHEHRRIDSCQAASSCGACTPLRGCGWCAGGDGSGRCLSEPNLCSGARFTWTWEPSACSASSADGGGTTAHDAGWTAVTDAGDAAVDSGDGGSCRWPASASTFSSADASLSGCLPSVGGNLCATSQYTLSCYGRSAVPDAGLACTVVPVPSPSDVLYYCCPCGG